jgi:hypothetical protein
LVVLLVLAHADEHLALSSVPPASSLYNLSYSAVIVASAYKEFEVIAPHFGFGAIVLRVEIFVEFLH